MALNHESLFGLGMDYWTKFAAAEQERNRVRSEKIVEAAKAWARAERELRRQEDDRARNVLPSYSGEDERRASINADYTEQRLLDVVEGRE